MVSSCGRPKPGSLGRQILPKGARIDSGGKAPPELLAHSNLIETETGDAVLAPQTKSPDDRFRNKASHKRSILPGAHYPPSSLISLFLFDI
jgi:hypothetical protein